MTEKTKTTAKPEGQKVGEPKSILVRLEGPGQELHVVGLKTAKGWRTSVQLRDRDAKSKKTTLVSRGASAAHAGMAQARKAIDGHVAEATKAGWKRLVSKAGGFAATPDAFTAKALPKPAR
jgi:hypothetical protein